MDGARDRESAIEKESLVAVFVDIIICKERERHNDKAQDVRKLD